jgi:hypothetical protein
MLRVCMMMAAERSKLIGAYDESPLDVTVATALSSRSLRKTMEKCQARLSVIPALWKAPSVLFRHPSASASFVATGTWR